MSGKAAPMVAYSKLPRYPRIKIEGDMGVKIRNWFVENKLSPLVPPIFPEFVIDYESAGRINVPVSQVPRLLSAGFVKCDTKPENIADISLPIPATLEPHTWMILNVITKLLVRYGEENTSYTADLYDNGKRSYSFEFDYNQIDPETGTFTIPITVEDDATQEELDYTEHHVIDTVMFIAAVQTYIFYHKPEEIPPEESPAPENAEPEKAKPAKPRPDTPRKPHPISIRSTVRKRIITISDDDSVPTRKYNYVTMIWQTRGHYQRYGKEKKLKYVAPYLSRRHQSKANNAEAELTNPQTYVIRQTYDPTPEGEE